MRITKAYVLFFAALLLLVAPQISSGADLDDLKAADNHARKLALSLNTADIEAYGALFHESFIWVGPEEAFPGVYTKEQLKQSKAADISSLESQSYTLIDAKYHVSGNTGIVCHYGTWVTKPKDGASVIRNYRYTFTFVKEGGLWLIYAGHCSVMPSGN